MKKTAIRKQLTDLVHKRRLLFWGVSEDALNELSEEKIVETILNYGSLADVKKLLAIMGEQSVAAIFRQQNNNERTNYYPQTANFFTIYFNRHVPTHS